jgi:hypothetical protein
MVISFQPFIASHEEQHTSATSARPTAGEAPTSTAAKATLNATKAALTIFIALL